MAARKLLDGEADLAPSVRVRRLETMITLQAEAWLFRLVAANFLLLLLQMHWMWSVGAPGCLDELNFFRIVSTFVASALVNFSSPFPSRFMKRQNVSFLTPILLLIFPPPPPPQMTEFRDTIGNWFPKVKRNHPPIGRTEFSSFRDLFEYLSEPKKSD